MNNILCNFFFSNMINIFAFWRWHCIESLYSTLHLTPSLYSHFFLSLLSLTLSSISTLSSFSFLSLLISLLSLLSHLLSLYFFCKKAQLFNIHNKILPELSLTSLVCFKCSDIRLADAHSTGISVIRYLFTLHDANNLGKKHQHVSWYACERLKICWFKNKNKIKKTKAKSEVLDKKRQLL